MTVNEAITRADALRPNTFEIEAKAACVIKLDRELAEMTGAGRREYDWPQEDPVLLMPAPHDGVYVLYLCCQIDLYNQETALYANDAAVYETALSEARAWWRRHNRAADKGTVRVL